MRDAPPEPTRSSAAAVFPGESFGSLLEKEIERSLRYYRGFGLMEVSTGPCPSARGGGPAREAGKPLGPPAPSAWLEAVSRTLRRADVVALGPEGEIYILLPETPASSMPVVSRRVEGALAQPDALTAADPTPVICQASFPRDGQTPPELLDALHEEH